MMYDLIKIQNGKETVYMTDSLPKIKDRLNQLRRSLRGQNVKLIYRLNEDKNALKYQKPPDMNYHPSGDIDTRSYINRKAKAKKVKRRNS